MIYDILITLVDFIMIGSTLIIKKIISTKSLQRQDVQLLDKQENKDIQSQSSSDDYDDEIPEIDGGQA